MLKRIGSTMAAIRSRLYDDEIVKKLLFHDSNNALQMLPPTAQDVVDYITLKPTFQFENKEDYTQNSIINIYMTEAMPQDDNPSVAGVIQINVICNVDIWELVDNKIRPLELSDRIITLVHNKKFTVSNKLVLNTITDLVINKKMVGYALLFEVTDGSGEKENL